MDKSNNIDNSGNVDNSGNIENIYDIDNFEIKENDYMELGELIMNLIDDYINSNCLNYSNPEFHENIKTYVKNNIDYLEEIDNIVNIDLDNIVDIFFSQYMDILTYNVINFDGLNGYRQCNALDSLNKEYATETLKRLRSINTHEQRTTEWFNFRWNHITASSAWKCFGTQKKQNEIILKKCKPIQDNSNTYVNLKSAFHHGHKFEPLSVMLYEEDKKTTIEDFGCLEHKDYPFLAASPDGINVDLSSNLYGRLLEIKNPVSRKITGIPKKDYWIQMQLQMACTGLHTCDFLETMFISYENEDEYNADGTFNKTFNGKQKGIIVSFWKDTEPIYEYAPLNISEEDFEEWNNKMFDKHKELSWSGNTYWKLDTYSCVSVPFCRLWFERALPYFEKVWNDVIHDREHGYAHRLPTKRKPKQNLKSIKKRDASGNEIEEPPKKKNKPNNKIEFCFDLVIDTEIC